MDWSVVGSAAFSLLGVVLGVGGSLVAQHLGMRLAREEAGANRLMALRLELKDAVHAFLQAAQEAESLAQKIHIGGVRDDAEAYAVVHQLWLAQRTLDLVCTDQLRGPAIALTDRIRDAIWNLAPLGASRPLWDYLDGHRAAFMDAARRELQASWA